MGMLAGLGDAQHVGRDDLWYGAGTLHDQRIVAVAGGAQLHDVVAERACANGWRVAGEAAACSRGLEGPTGKAAMST
jgi:hypothetical protein